MKMVRNLEVPTTASELRDVLLLQLSELRAGQILPERAKEVSNAAGKAIKTAALQIEYAAVNKIKAKCAFVADAD
jgi:hypothetical protein